MIERLVSELELDLYEFMIKIEAMINEARRAERVRV